MANEQLKQLYDVLDDTTALLHKTLGNTYLDAAIESGENLMAHTVHQEDGLPNQATVDKLMAQYQTLALSDYSAEELRQALQLVLVKAVQTDGIEPNKQVTPDAMASLATFVATTFHAQMPETMTVADPTVGSGNLLYAVMNQLHAAKNVTVKGVGIDNDDTLLAFADMSASLQHLDVQLFHQDALADLPVTNTDLVVADLPVGYYPLDERAKTFATAAASGHSYAHHLLIEQSLKLLKPGSFGLFYVPANVFKSKEAAGLTAWMTKAAHFQGLLNLPESLFADPAAQKSLLILQKPGVGTKQAQQVLLGTFPDLSDQKAFTEFIANVQAWAKANLA